MVEVLLTSNLAVLYNCKVVRLLVIKCQKWDFIHSIICEGHQMI